MKLNTEPAVVTSCVVAVLGFIAPTIVLDDTQKALITGAITAVLAILGGLHIRGKVTPTSVAQAAVEEAKTASAVVVREVVEHPDVVAQSIAAITSGPHPMQSIPVAGADATLPAPQPQGTYDAALNPLHAVYTSGAQTNGSSPASGKHLASNA